MLSATYKPFMLNATYKPFMLSATYKPFMLSVIMLNVIMLHAVYGYAECCGTALTQTAWHCDFTRNFSIFFKIAFVGIIACVNTPLSGAYAGEKILNVVAIASSGNVKRWENFY
jgi:hypothetical protein